jgi:hypothetical protein
VDRRRGPKRNCSQAPGFRRRAENITIIYSLLGASFDTVDCRVWPHPRVLDARPPDARVTLLRARTNQMGVSADGRGSRTRSPSHVSNEGREHETGSVTGT